MGWKYDDKSIKCPLFKGVLRTTKGQVNAIQCAPLNVKLGWDVQMMLRHKTYSELKDYVAVLCKGDYTSCPYYQFYIKSDCCAGL